MYPVVVEVLEPRQLLSVAATTPPKQTAATTVKAVVVHHTPSQLHKIHLAHKRHKARQLAKAAAAKKATPAPAPTPTKAPAFELLDTTFNVSDTAPGFTRAWWPGAAAFSPGDGTFDPSQARVTNLANIAKHGGVDPWPAYPVAAGSPTFLDFELDSTEDPSYYQQRAEWFHTAAPGVPLGTWGLHIGEGNLIRDQVINPTPAQQQMMDNLCRTAAGLVNSLDFITISAYMLGPAYVDRDLAYIGALAQEYHKMFPGKPVIAWTWGAYDSTWNPPNSVLSDDVTQRYISTIMQNCNGMLVWGPEEDNMKLRQMANQMVQAAANNSVASTAPASSLFSDKDVSSDLGTTV
jgi:hypothetical protein